jgi:hypothetical protein
VALAAFLAIAGVALAMLRSARDDWREAGDKADATIGVYAVQQVAPALAVLGLDVGDGLT